MARKGGYQKPWSAKEDRLLRTKYPTLGVEKASRLLKRPINGVRNRAYKLGVSVDDKVAKPGRPSVYTKAEDALICRFFPKIPTTELAGQMGKSLKAIGARAILLGLKGPQLTKRQRKRYRINPKTGCWEWLGYIDKKGYAIGRGNKGVTIYAYRQSYIESKGPIPEDCEVDHRCRNRRCINPEHLEAVTHAVNVQRGRVAKLTEEDVDFIRANRGILAKQLAQQFNVHKETIYRVRRADTWRHESGT